MSTSRRDYSTQDMGYRELAFRASTLNEDERSIEATISTETPVPMVDWARMEMVPEVLLSKGAEYPKSRQIPFLDSHNRASVKDQLGSARNVTVEDGKISARLHFSNSANGAEAFTAVREGHITDVSVGYEVLKRVFVPAGETKTVGNRSFDGPVNVVTKWRLREVSLTPIGADAQAKLRGLDPAAIRFESEKKGQFSMNPELRKLAIDAGMPESHSDEEAQRWLVANPEAIARRAAEKKAEAERKAAEQTRKDEPVNVEKVARDAAAEALRAYKEEQEARRAYLESVNGVCELAGLPDQAEHCRGLKTLDEVRTHLQKIQAERAKEQSVAPGIVRVTGEGFDRLQRDMGASLTIRALEATGASQANIEKVYPAANRPKDLERFRHARLFDCAQEFVRGMGIDPFPLTREQVAICAMFGPESAGLRSVRNYHTTGSFANITLDAINKSMQLGYMEFPATWRGPMRQGTSVADFKNINRIRIGGVPNLPVWNDTTNPETAGVTDGKEVYAVEARSIGVPFSYRLIVNDDMDALSRTPQMLGDAASRTVNAVAWSQITSNPTMSDGVALFSAASGARKRQNLTTGAGAPSTTTVNSLTSLMMQMRGENTPEGNEGPDILALQPRYLACPSAMRATVLALLTSTADPGGTHAGVVNVNTNLIPVVEPLLDASSTTAWYLFASPSQIDTVEVTFMQGQESPVVRTVTDPHNLAVTYYVLQSFGARPLNHRGIQKHAGA